MQGFGVTIRPEPAETTEALSRWIQLINYQAAREVSLARGGARS
jgi:hypothetical protein